MTENAEYSSLEKEYEANLALSYEYIEKSLKEVQDINNSINTQLGLLIGFNFTFIRFFLSDLPDRNIDSNSLPCNSCLVLKLLAFGFAIASISWCLLGLYKTIKFYIIPPKLLIENCDRVSSQELKLAIIDTWQEKLESFQASNSYKKQLVNRSIFLLLLSGVMVILDKLVASILY